MTVFRKPALKAIQGESILFLTAFTVHDFRTAGFYSVDALDVRGSQGGQRLLDEDRANRFSKDILAAAAIEEGSEVFLPISVFLATSGNIDYDEEKQELFFDSAEHAGVCPLDVVDGQHRIKGLLMAAEKNEDLLDFPISTIIAPDMREVERMLQFVIINTKQRTVDRGVSQHIIARFHRMLQLEELPHFPLWLDRLVRGDGIDRALSIVKALNNDERSPWRGRVQLADENKLSRHTVKQASFVQSVRRYLLPDVHPLNKLPSEKRIDILINFWKAVDKILVDDPHGKPTVFRQTALEFFHRISTPVIANLAEGKTYTVDRIEECIRSAQDYLPPAEAGILSPEYWESGGLAGQQNRGGMERLATVFLEAFRHANEDDTEV